MKKNSIISNLLGVYKTSFSDHFKKLTFPLEKYYSFDYVSYRWISHNGDLFDISNDPAVSEEFYYNEIYKSSPFKHHPNNYLNGVYLPSAIKNDKYHDLTSKIAKKYPFGMFIVKKRENGAHFFSLGSSNKNIALGIAMNNLSIFDKFCDYILENVHSEPNKIEPFLVNISTLIGQKNFLKKPKLYLGTDLESKEDFLKSIGIHENGALEYINLSRRENECLKLFIEGRSIKELAAKLYISTRTVEFHIQNINKKLHCKNRCDILKKIDYLKMLGLY